VKTVFIGGERHGRLVDIDPQQQSMPAGGADRGCLYVRRMARDADGRWQFIFVLDRLDLDYGFKLAREFFDARAVAHA
jgi:hypothetical protein